MYKTNVLRDGRQYLVSTVNTPFDGWETMVFAYELTGKVNFRDLYCNRYDNEAEAKSGHEEVLKTFSTITFY
jgi:hypothetical protein